MDTDQENANVSHYILVKIWTLFWKKFFDFMSRLITMKMDHRKQKQGKSLSAFQTLEVVKFLNGRLKVNYCCQKNYLYRWIHDLHFLTVQNKTLQVS